MKAIITTMLLLSIFINVEGQSIRKNHLEMIPEEWDAFVQLCYDEQQLIDDLGIYHSANFSSIHFMYRKNPPTPELDVFLAWHRRMIIELEHKIQEHCPCISVPFWDWRADNSTSSSLWSNNFLGQFNGNWGLNRNLGTNGALPTSTNVTNVQSISNWDSYTSTLESSVVHTGPHGWVGGVMNSGASPRDPVFYLHHGMIDKLWQEWTEAGNATNYVKTDMPRYDGAYLRYDNVILPSVNPNSISNSDDLGVFFAENKSVIMKNYTVQNTYRPNEVFYYQFDVNTQDNFNVANGGTAEIRSGKSVTLKPGTTLWFESDTKVAINGCNFSEYRLGKESTIVKANFYNPNSERVYEKYKTNNLIEKHHNIEPDILFSNFSAVVNSNSNLKIKSVILLDMTGKVVYRKNNISQSKYEIPFDDFSSGVYSIHSIFEDNSTYSKLISIKK